MSDENNIPSEEERLKWLREMKDALKERDEVPAEDRYMVSNPDKYNFPIGAFNEEELAEKEKDAEKSDKQVDEDINHKL